MAKLQNNNYINKIITHVNIASGDNDASMAWGISKRLTGIETKIRNNCIWAKIKMGHQLVMGEYLRSLRGNCLKFLVIRAMQ